MRPLFIDLPSQACLAWAVAWLVVSRQPGREVWVREEAEPTRPLGWQPIGSRVLRPDAEPAANLFAFCKDNEVPFEACGHLFLGGHAETARLLDLFQSASRRQLNVLNLPPDGLRSRYPDAGFADGVRGMLDLEAGRIEPGALGSALRERACELGAQSQQGVRRPRGTLHLRRGKAVARLELHGVDLNAADQSARAIHPSCILSGLPEPGLAELAPWFDPGESGAIGGIAGSMGGEVIVRPAWRGWLLGKRSLLRHQKPWRKFQALLPDGLRENPNAGTRVRSRSVDVDIGGTPLPFELRPDGRLFGASPEPIDLFEVAARIATAVDS